MISLKKVVAFLAGGAVAQGAAAVAGLLLARWMPVQQYAIYTVAVAMVGAIAVLTKGGVRMGLSATLSKVWPERRQSAVAVASSIKARLTISAIMMPPILIFSWILLTRAHADLATTAAIVLILGLVWIADLRSSVIDQILFFDARAVRVQNLDTAIAIGRAILTLSLQLFYTVSVIAALIVNFLAVAARIPLIQRWVHQTLGTAHADAAPAVTRSIKTVALRQMPVDLFTVLQAQAAIYFLTTRGDTTELATYGALARIAQILTPFSAISLAFFVPAFASTNSRVLSRIARYCLLGSVPGLLLALWTAILPETLLFFIGPAYADRAHTLLVCASCVAFTSAVQVGWSLVYHRGWNRFAWVSMPFGALWFVAAPFFLPMTRAEGGYIFYAGFSVGTLVALGVDLVWAQRLGEISLLGDRAPPTAATAPRAV